MTIDRKGSEPFSLRRWSQRKLAAGRDGPAQAPADSEERRPRDEATARAVSPPEIAPSASGVLPPAAPVHAAASSLPVRESPESALPPIESLTIDSDFSPFMRPGVDESVRRSALRKLLRDPRFNVMDGLDVYIDDYSKPSPIEPEILRTLVQARYLFDPPKTRVNEAGHVEDITETAEERQAASVPAEDAVATPEPGSANPAPKDVES